MPGRVTSFRQPLAVIVPVSFTPSDHARSVVLKDVIDITKMARLRTMIRSTSKSYVAVAICALTGEQRR